jgi:hypothetical protein
MVSLRLFMLLNKFIYNNMTKLAQPISICLAIYSIQFIINQKSTISVFIPLVSALNACIK